MCKCKPETVEEVVQYFFVIGSDSEAANWFYDYFESNGWKVSGRTAMKNWQAAARNWVRRNQKWDAPKPGNSKLQRMKTALARA